MTFSKVTDTTSYHKEPGVGTFSILVQDYKSECCLYKLTPGDAVSWCPVHTMNFLHCKDPINFYRKQGHVFIISATNFGKAKHLSRVAKT